MRRILAAALMLVASPAWAEPIVLPFAPPIDQALTYRIEQHRPVAGKVSAFTAIRDLRFDRAGDGYGLSVTLRSIDTDAPAAGAEPYRAALEPLVGITMRFRLDGRGQVVALDDMDAVWGRVQAGLKAMLTGPEGDRQRAAKNVQALFDGLSPEGRLALLAGEIRPLFLFAAGEVEDGAGRGLRTVAGSPLGRPVPVEGSVVVAGQQADALDLKEILSGQGVQVAIRYHLSRTTGLVENQERSLIVGGQALVESRSLTAVK